MTGRFRDVCIHQQIEPSPPPRASSLQVQPALIQPRKLALHSGNSSQHGGVVFVHKESFVIIEH